MNRPDKPFGFAILTTGLLLLGGCAAPLFGTDEPQKDRTSSQETPEKADSPRREQTETTAPSGVEEMEIEPEDILQGGADPEKNATQAPSRQDDTLKNPQEEDQESESSKDQERNQKR